MRKFLIDGQEVEVIERVAAGVIVRRILEYGDGEECCSDDPEIVPAVFDNPPTEKQDAAIKVLEALVANLHTTIHDLDLQVRERTRVLNKLSQFSGYGVALARIEDVIEGRVTHYVVMPEYAAPSIVEAVGGGVPWEHKTKLLCLFGGAGKDLQWRVNQYYDGSGSSWTTVEPFTSRDAAVARLQQVIDEWGSTDNQYKRKQLFQAAVANSLDIPPALAEWVKADAIKAAQAGVDEAANKLQEAEKALAKARCEA